MDAVVATCRLQRIDSQNRSLSLERYVVLAVVVHVGYASRQVVHDVLKRQDFTSGGRLRRLAGLIVLVRSADNFALVNSDK